MMKLNRMLRDARLKSGYSQLEVARELGLTSPQYISNIEREICPPSVEALVKMGQLYKIQQHEIIDLMLSEYRRSLQDRFSQAKVSVNVRNNYKVRRRR